MPITFTPQERKDITRRQLNIQQENTAFASTNGQLGAERTKLLNVDAANAVFYNFNKDRAVSYETEARQMDGTIPATYTDGVIDPYSPGDLSTSAKTPGSAGAVFFPASPIYVFFAPKIIDSVNGYLHPVGTDARYELNILSNGTIYDGLTQMIFRLDNGVSGGGTTTTTSSVPAGVQTNLVLLATITAGFSPGQLVYIGTGANCGIYQIVSIVASTSITVNSIVHTQNGIGSGATINGSVAAFSPTDRQNLSATYQEILNNITNKISSLIAEWEGKIDAQISTLNANNETRSPQTTQNATALADVNNTKSIIDAWQALPNTGITGKYTSGSMAPISAEITARNSFIPTRIAQIVTALGNVSQVGDAFSGVVGSPYYERYKWLNIRINKATGSARRFYGTDDGINFLTMLSGNNNAIKAEYDLYFTTKKITANDATTIIEVTDLAGLAAGDAITVLSETQPELPRAIIELMGTTQIRMDRPIPNSYLQEDLARIFKTL